MHHIIYMSRATTPLGEDQLRLLLEQARSLNAQQNITGMLLYGNEQFLQVLEGEESAVRATYERIRQDSRHRDMIAYADKAIQQRSFPEWSMAYHTPSPEQQCELASYVPPTRLRIERPGMTLADTQLLQLLRTFVIPD